LPEVEFCRRALTRWTAGRRVVHAEVLDPRSVRLRRGDRPTAGHPDGAAHLAAVVSGASPGPLLRHGKRLLWSFGDGALLLHLGMTGKWTRIDARHAKVRLHLDEGPPLTFADPRLLGGVVPTTSAAGAALLAEGLGPDALDAAFPRLAGTRAVKVALLDQSVVAGLGNLHAAEALWRAGIHPATPCEALTPTQRRRLREGVRDQLGFALDLLDRDEEILYTEEPGAPNPFPLYQRGGEPCPRCGTAIAKMEQAGRTTWWCPGCQGVPPRSARGRSAAGSARAPRSLARPAFGGPPRT
jgi:formamidopyrimidine-DNA glycosylase